MKLLKLEIDKRLGVIGVPIYAKYGNRHNSRYQAPPAEGQVLRLQKLVDPLPAEILCQINQQQGCDGQQ